MAEERIQKILARGGIASRRAAEKLISEGRVRVNGRVVQELGAKADPFKDRVDVDGKRVVAETAVYVVLHKPRGMVSTMSDPEGRPTVAELLGALGARVYPVGRLDFSTSGVLLATNDGDFANGMLHPKKKVPKTYVLKVQGLMNEADVERWRHGVELDDGKTLPAQVKVIRHEAGKTWIEVTLQEGRNQQIRRMGEATGFPVMRLARTSFAGVTSEGLAPGRLRRLTRDELVLLKKEYGVPKRIPALPADEEDRDTRRRPANVGRSGHAQPVGSRREASRRGGPSDRARGGESRETRGESRGESRGASRGSSTRGASRGGGESRGAPSRGGSGRGGERAEYSYRATESESPRLGGGAPGRRGYDVREDWGGGSGRGRSGTRDEGEGSSAPPGRGGRSRTTGTGGGIGAGSGDYRVNRGRDKRGR